MFRGSKTIAIITIFVVAFILIFALGGYFIHNNKYRDTINNVYLGEVGIDYNYTGISFPHAVYSSTDFNVTVFFHENISINAMYTQTIGFKVMHWTFIYNDYTMEGGGQGNFTGTFVENMGVLNITLDAPSGYYNGNISLHMVGDVPVTVIY
jgi:hypothetical protein